MRKKTGVSKICPTCGEEFYLPRCHAHREYCSRKCRSKGKKVNKICPTCGKEFWLYLNHAHRTYCSQICSSEAQKIYNICKHCGKIFNARSRGIRDYCTCKCMWADPEWRRAVTKRVSAQMLNRNMLNFSDKPSSLEVAGRGILESLGYKLEVDFREQVLIDDIWLVDVLFKSSNLVIEWDGDYWHNLPGRQAVDKRKTTYLRSKGLEVIRFWEHEVHKSAESTTESLRVILQNGRLPSE